MWRIDDCASIHVTAYTPHDVRDNLDSLLKGQIKIGNKPFHDLYELAQKRHLRIVETRLVYYKLNTSSTTKNSFLAFAVGGKHQHHLNHAGSARYKRDACKNVMNL